MRLPLLLLLLLFLLLTFLGGCQKELAPRHDPPHQMTLAYTSQPDCTLIHLAMANNYFAEEGLEVRPQMHVYGRQALQSLLEGKADLAAVAETPVMFATFKGEKVFVLSTISYSNKNMAVIGRKDRGISVPEDLKGKRLAFTPDTTSEFFMEFFLNANHLSRRDAGLMVLEPDEMIAALLADKIDAAVTWNFPLAILRKALGEKGVTFYDIDIYKQTFNVTAQQAFVRKNPETIKRFLRGLIKAEEFARSHPREAQSRVAAALQIDKELLQEIWEDFDFRVTLDRSLLISLEDESRWAVANRLVEPREKLPNYLNIIYPDLLKEIKAEAVSLSR